MNILNLHSHTEFSNLSCGFKDSLNKLPDLLEYAFENGHAGIGLTDHESVSGHIRAFNWYQDKLAKATDEEKERLEKFQIILGNEIYIARKDLTQENHKTGEQFYHFLLLALDEVGQAQLRRLSSLAWEKGYFKYVMRRFNYISELEEIIGSNPGHIVATTACIANVAGQAFLNNSEEHAKLITDDYLQSMVKIFGKDNFFLELFPALYKDQIEYNKFLYKNYKDSYNFVITNDVHFLTKEDWKTFEILIKSNPGRSYDVESVYKYSHFMTWEEIVKNLDYMPKEFLEIAAGNSLAIGKRASYYSLKHPVKIPQIPFKEIVAPKDLVDYGKQFDYIKKFLESSHKQDRFLISKALSNYNRLIKNPEESKPKTFERLNNELGEIWEISTILGLRMSDYMITMSKVIDIVWEVGSVVGPGRGSAVAFVLNYLLEITQVNPLEYPIQIPHWRFISSSRPDLPDIDYDTPGSDRELILRTIAEYFESIGGQVVQVVTYGTETTKKALNTAGRGLGLPDDDVRYITSLVPSPRGMQYTLTQCYFGDEENRPIAAFKEQMDMYPELWEAATKIEGLITQMGVHAAGLILSNEPIWTNNSIMKTKKGILVTAYDLHESEETGLIKYDNLSVDGLGKIKNALLLLLKHKKIEWKGSLKETYFEYLWPQNIQPTQEVWNNIAANKVNSLWQLNTPVGQAALSSLHASSVQELGMINSLMRLMAQHKGDKPPIKVFEEYRNNIGYWYTHMQSYQLTPKEVKIMEDHLLPLYGLADTQEAIMLLTMDERIAGFGIAEANLLRKGVAKKSLQAQQEAKDLFYEWGLKRGTSRNLLDYIWREQIGMSLGYSFSVPHTAAYSYIALQQAYLYTEYAPIYWNTACLIEDAAAFTEEDFEDLIELGYIKSTKTGIQEIDEEMEASTINRDKVATSIAHFQSTITVEAPDINISGFGFTADEAHNSIKTGLKIVSRLGNQIIYDIIQNRPYVNFEDFQARVKISKDRLALLIKAGAFRNIDSRTTKELLEDYCWSVAGIKHKLNGQNINMLINMGLLPEKHFGHNIKVFHWYKYIQALKDKKTLLYTLDDNALRFFSDNFNEGELVYDSHGRPQVSVKYVKSEYDKAMNLIKLTIKKYEKELLKLVNDKLYEEVWEKYGMEQEEEGQMEALRMYPNKHPLAVLDIERDSVEDLKEDNYVDTFFIQGRRFPKYYIYKILGTVVAKDKLKETITLLTPEGAVQVKFFKENFAYFDRKLVDVEDGKKITLQDSFFKVGTHLLIYGAFKNGQLFPKKYKDTGTEKEVYRVKVENNEIAYEEKMEENDSSDI